MKHLTVPSMGKLWPHYPHAVLAGGLCFTSEIAALSPEGGAMECWTEVDGGRPSVPDFPVADPVAEAVGVQSWVGWKQMQAIFRAAGGDLTDLLRERYYFKQKRYFPILEKARIAQQPKDPCPSVGIGATAIDPHDRLWATLEAVGVARGEWPDGQRSMLRFSGGLGPLPTYNTAVEAGPYIFCSGQSPIDTTKPGIPLIKGFDDVPPEGRFMQANRSHTDFRNGPIAAQTWFVYNRRKEQMEAAGLRNEDIVNMTVFLQDMRDFYTFHEVHQRFFPERSVALTVTEFPEVGHKGTLIETEVTAVRGARPRKTVHEVPGYRPRHHTALAVVAERLIFITGQTGCIQNDRWPASGPGDLDSGLRPVAAGLSRICGRPEAVCQAILIFERLRAILAQLDRDLSALAKMNLFVTSFDDLAAFELVCARYLPGERPAFTCVRIPNVGPVPGSRFCLEAIGVVE
jgi:enamine deaminase RidA (YjgF/YER057c/UK114 family)